MESLLITGGAGFIGSNLVRLALARTAARVVVLDRLTYAGHRASLADVAGHPRFAFVHGSIADRAMVEALLREHAPDAIVNLAAETHVDRSIDGPRPFVETNLVGTFEILEATRRHCAARPDTRLWRSGLSGRGRRRRAAPSSATATAAGLRGRL